MSRTPNRVIEIIEDTLETPIPIPNYLHRDTPFNDLKKQIAPYNLKKHVSEYQNVDPTSLMRFLIITTKLNQNGKIPLSNTRKIFF